MVLREQTQTASEFLEIFAKILIRLFIALAGLVFIDSLFQCFKYAQQDDFVILQAARVNVGQPCEIWTSSIPAYVR